MAAQVESTDPNAVSLRDLFGKHVLTLAAGNERIVMLDADLSASTRTGAFIKRWPQRHLNIGIAEQNMVGIAAGMAIAGYIPFVNTFASFLTRRACDQIAISVAYPRLNVKFFGFHSGINLGEDGATQQSVEDLGIMQAIPGIRVYSPIDAHDLQRVMDEVSEIDGPTYVRLSRFPAPLFTPAPQPGERVADYSILRPGQGSASTLTVVTTGTIASKALVAAATLEAEGHSVRVVGVTRIKPLGESLTTLLRGATRIAVLEEHNIHGGLADSLSCLLDQAGQPHCLTRIGIQDRFGESGPPEALLEAFGLAGPKLLDALRKAASSLH